MYRRELNNANAVKRMIDFLGHSNNFTTLSLSLSLSQALTYNSLYIIKTRGRPRVNIRLSLHPCKGGRIVFYSHRNR